MAETIKANSELNSLALAAKFSSELDKIVTQKAVTGFMTDNVFRQKFVGAKTVIMPDIDFVGLADYDHDEGFTKGATTISQQSFTLTKDRGRQLMLDREDLDETGIANLAGQVLGEFARTKVVPEVDAYVISKLAGVAQANSNQFSLGENDDNEYKLFLRMVNKVHGAAGFDEELVAFVNPTVYAALMTLPEFQRQIVVSDFKKGEIDVKVKSINGVAIIPVTADRMRSTIEFTDNGFTPGGAEVGILVLPKKAASLVKKTESMRIFTPEQNKDADAYVFNYRLYYDVFVKKSNLKHIAAYLYA